MKYTSFAKHDLDGYTCVNAEAGAQAGDQMRRDQGRKIAVAHIELEAKVELSGQGQVTQEFEILEFLVCVLSVVFV